MTSKKYINFEKLNQPTFDAYLFANTLVRETHKGDDGDIDLEVPFRKIQYDLEEITEQIQEEVRNIQYFKKTANENMTSIKNYAKSLITSFQQIDDNLKNKYEKSVFLLKSLQNMHETNQLLLKVHESIILIRRLEHLYQEIKDHNNDEKSWKDCVRIASIIHQWKTLLKNHLADISIVTEYVPFVTSISEKLESMAYDVLFVQKNHSKLLFVSVISTYFLLDENSLISNLKKYNEKSVKDAIECFYKGIEIKPALRRLSTTDPAKAMTTLLTNIEKSWKDVKDISERVYILSTSLEEPVSSFLKETFFIHGNTILSNILEKLNNQTPIQYFWTTFSFQLVQKIEIMTKQSSWFNEILPQQLDFILRLMKETFHHELHDLKVQEFILKHIQSHIIKND
ncbi:hypothetical protein PCANB_002631 [Pneumocystis canis]|nr:hypothetical protein PCANB_002631 [Pneumocystis canis]